LLQATYFRYGARVRRTSFKGANCSVAATLEIVGEWWSLLVIRAVFMGLRRFDEIQERLGIARNVLTVRLRSLVAHGVLERVAYQERPPRFEYRLTDKGRALFPVIVSLMAWGDRWVARHGPPLLFVDRESGQQVEPALVDRITGRPLEASAVRAVPGPGATEATRRFLERRRAGLKP
jgi:DNA-binding HxlR family transcriptional regulator